MDPPTTTKAIVHRKPSLSVVERGESSGGSNPSREVIRLPASNPMSDEELIQCIARGDEKATNLLYDRLFPTVDRTLCRVLGQRDDDYDDLVQTVFERIIVSLVEDRFSNRCRLTTWASSIASHVGIDAIRARQRRRKRFASNPELHIESKSAQGNEVEGQLEARSAFVLVREALTKIDPSKARILALYHLEGHGVGEVASIMGLSEEACQSRLVRGRRKFLEELEKLERGNES